MTSDAVVWSAAGWVLSTMGLAAVLAFIPFGIFAAPFVLMGGAGVCYRYARRAQYRDIQQFNEVPA